MASDSSPRFRSGAVARMVSMPVTTLRVWERRYGLGHAERSAGGHRLYAAADVERLALIKRLTQRGHAIGAVAHLGLEALHQVAVTHEAHCRAGTDLLRDVQDDDARSATEVAATPAVQWVEALPISARRYDDLTLSDFAGRSSTIACECPRHLAELLLQLSHFEASSAGCASRSPADVELHEYLHRVAAASRALFEQALERVAEHEGLLLKR